MATDATGTPTSKGIPTYNPDADAPSGAGFNAAMQSIDSLLDSYVPKVAGIAAGEVPVWNGSAFVRSSVTNIGPSSLGSGSPDATKFLRGDGTWAVPSGMSFGTALPGSPSDGDLFILTDSTSAPTYQWLLRYVAAKATNKWICIGGAPKVVEVATAETTSSASYAALSTAGPSFTTPVAGDWVITVGSLMKYSSGGGTFEVAFHSFDVGGTGAVDADAFAGASNNTTTRPAIGSRVSVKTGVAASTAFVSKYRTTTNTWTFSDRRMQVMPLSLGG